MAKRTKGAQTVRGKAAYRDSKQPLIVAGKVLAAQGQDDFTRGHISLRLPDDPNLFFMKAYSIGLDEIMLQNILTIDLEGNVVAGSARRHSEVVVVTGASIEEAVIGTIMLENAAMVQLLAEAAGDPAPDFPRADIEQLKHDISQPEQFKINFDYLVSGASREAPR